MPRSFKVLLPARIRTPRPPEGGPGPLLSWVFLRLSRASTERPGPSFPDPALVCFLRLFSRRRAARHSRALRDGRIALLSRAKATLMRSSTRARSSVSPEVRGARRANPTRQKRPCVAKP
jgi:hypothetical protein